MLYKKYFYNPLPLSEKNWICHCTTVHLNIKHGQCKTVSIPSQKLFLKSLYLPTVKYKTIKHFSTLRERYATSTIFGKQLPLIDNKIILKRKSQVTIFFFFFRATQTRFIYYFNGGLEGEGGKRRKCMYVENKEI